MSKSQFSVSEILRITGKSRTTISKHMEEGKLSFTIAEGKKLVDAAELMRVYGADCNFDSVSKEPSRPSTSPLQNSGDGLTQQHLELERIERERERGQLLNQIEYLKDALGTSQEGHNRATLLLENHSSGGGTLEAGLSALEKRMEHQEFTAKEELELAKKLKRQNRQLKLMIQKERNKSFWERLFGARRRSALRPANS